MLKRTKQTSPQRKKKGQSTVEYIILVAAILGALIVFIPTFRSAFTTTMESGTDGMQDMANALKFSHGKNSETF